MNRKAMATFAVLGAAFITYVGCSQPVSEPDHLMAPRGRFNLSPGSAPPAAFYSVGMPASALAPPGALPSLDEEVWVIQRCGTEQAASEPDEQTPGSGTLKAKVADKEIPLPLKHTDMKAQISGYIGAVQVTQEYQNPYESKIEAVYVFPLPHNAAVNEFIMTIGERKIRGIIRDRQEAEQVYREARQQGYVASLLTQERPNIFTQKVANIEPSKTIDINIKYFHTLAYNDGHYEFVFPMVVGPRFNPPGSTTGIGAVARGSQGASGQQTEVQYLRPGERGGHDIAVSVSIDAGVGIEQIESPSHVIAVERPAAHKAEVTLGSLDRIPNRDFVLRYKVSGNHVKSAMLMHRDQRGGFFTLMLYPPDELAVAKRKPLELIFLLDCSGSMAGQPIAQSKNAMTRALRHLQPGDSFQIIRFSNNASQLGQHPLEATRTNVARGLAYVESLRGEGGTMVIEGVKAALDFPHDPARLRFVCLMTDGFIGNEAEILRETNERLGASRIFSFGVGSAPNRYFLEGMAKVGRGAVAYLGLNDSGSQVMDLFFDRISHPAMTDLQINWGGMQVTDVFPERIPDLFAGRPVIVTGRFKGTGSTNVRVQGRLADKTGTITVPASLDDKAAQHEGLPVVWARMKIANMSDWTANEPGEQLAGQVKLLCPASVGIGEWGRLSYTYRGVPDGGFSNAERATEFHRG